jgi:hypothetical protein
MAEKSYDFDFRWKSENGEIVPNDTKIEKADSPLWQEIPEKFRELVLSGGLLATVGSVTASAKIEEKGKKTEKSAIGSYVRLEAVTPAAALALMDGRMSATKDGAGVLTRFNYGYDLDARGTIRNPLLQKLEGPEKAIDRAMKGLMGLPGMTEALAREIIAKGAASAAAAPATAAEPAAS